MLIDDDILMVYIDANGSWPVGWQWVYLQLRRHHLESLVAEVNWLFEELDTGIT